MQEDISTQDQAQERLDQIQAFQNELARLEQQHVLELSTDQKESVSSHHNDLIKHLSLQHDVDTSAQSRQLSLGMKIASLAGALAFSIAVFFLFYQFWGYFSFPLRVITLVSVTSVTLIATLYLAFREKQPYFSKLLGLISIVCMGLNLSMLGSTFNITPSPNAFLILAAYSALLAYACKARVMLFFAIVFVSNFIAMKAGTFWGIYWISFGEYPENFFAPAIVLFLIATMVNHKHYSGFASTYRVCALLLIFLPMLILANWGRASHLTMDANFIEGIYQTIGFLSAAGFVGLGIRKHWPSVTNTSNVFLLLFIYTKFFDWWWDWLPKYLFFFLLGLTALLVMLMLKRLRLQLQESLA